MKKLNTYCYHKRELKIILFFLGILLNEVIVMKKRFFILVSLLIAFILLFPSNSYASTTLSPVNGNYTEGIYKIDAKDSSSYNLQYRFLTPNEKCTIIILDENNNTIFKSIKCPNQCDAGIINNKNTLIILTDGEVFLYFNKL